MPTASSTEFDNTIGRYSLRDLLTIVFKRRNLIVTFAITVLVVVTSVTVLLPRSYDVTATLLVNKARAEVPMAPTDSRQLIISQVSEEDLNTEIEVLKSRQLIEAAVKSLAAEEPLDPSYFTSIIGRVLGSVFPDEEESVVDDAVLHLQDSLDVRAVRKSNVLRVSYRSTDPVWATRVVGALTDEYLEQRTERYQSPQAVSFFVEQMRAAEQQLAERERALEGFVDEASITMVSGPQGTDSLAAQKAIMMNRLAKLENDVGDAEALLQEQTHQVSSLKVRIIKEPERLQSASRNNQDAATEEIERGLAALRLRRDALLQDFRPDSRHVGDIDTQIRLAEERLRQEQEDTYGINRTEINPVYLELKSELLRTEADLEGTRARVVSLRAQASQSRKALDNLNVTAFQLDILDRDARAAEENYLLYQKKHEEARISAAMDQEKFINVTVAQPAQIPLRPVPRQLVLKLFLALLIGILGGVGFAFGLESYVDRSFTTGEEIERKLGIPHIASIPEGNLAG